MSVDAIVIRRARGGCIVENHHNEDGHRSTSEDVPHNANQLHAIIERAQMFVNSPASLPPRPTRWAMKAY